MNMTEFQKEFLDKPEFEFDSKTESITVDSYEFKDFSFDYFSGLCDTNNIKHISLNDCKIEKSVVIFNREIEVTNSIFSECHFDFETNKNGIQHFVIFKNSTISDSNIDLNQFNKIVKTNHVDIKNSDQIAYINASTNNNFVVIDTRDQMEIGSFSNILLAESVVKISDATFRANELNKTPNLKYDRITSSKEPDQIYGSGIINKDFQDTSSNIKIEAFFDGIIDNSFKKNPILTVECLKQYITENHDNVHLIEPVRTEKFTVKFEKLSETLLVSKNASLLEQKEALKDIANEIQNQDNKLKLSNIIQNKQNEIEQKQAISFER